MAELPPSGNVSAAAAIRLQKFIADAGVCSRRAAEALIARGEVWVNGAAATPGTHVTPGVDKVTVSGKPVRAAVQPKITVAVHKPRGHAGQCRAAALQPQQGHKVARCGQRACAL